MTKTLTRRKFGKLASAAGLAAASAAAFSTRPVLGAGKAKVVVIGGGAGGATVARYVAKDAKDIEVTLVEANRNYTTCFFSNLYIGGFRSFESITHGYDTLASQYGIKVVHDRATGIDPAKKTVKLNGGGTLSYDRLVVAPGIEMKYDTIEGYSAQAAQTMPHAWQAGPQTQILKRQLLEMEDGGTVVIAPPPNPFRCPPGPYERTSMVAHYLKHYKPRSKIVILDAKNKFSKQKLFEDGWAQYYPGLIEWVPLEITGGVQMVDVKAMTVKTTSETVKASVANIIPAQRAGRIAQVAGLADKSGWCPVEPATLASKLQPDIHLVGDAIIPGDMPKSGFSANSQAKACAMAVRVALADAKGFPPRFRNTCWSLVATDDAIKVGATYKATEEKIAKTEGFISKAGEDDKVRAATAKEAVAWYDGIMKDIFG
jgi:NADPH-dependent 2,4-dienoyl-CoA reductase/sulfur reductase-like enzyme